MKIKYVIFTAVINICFLSNCNSQNEVIKSTLTISIKDVDSTDSGFALLYLFREGFNVQDTFADINGNFIIKDMDNIESIIIRASACYPQIKTIGELKQDSIIFLKESEVLMKTGGMGVDSVLNEMNNLIELKINNWNLR
jgi:hypothetical protein